MPEELQNVQEEQTVEEVTQETEQQESVEENADYYPEDFGEEVTFEDIINDPTFAKEYRRMVDKEVSKAIKSYQKNHDMDVEELVRTQVAEQVNEVKFQSKLREALKDAGVIDTVGYMAHLDMEVLKDCFNPETNEIEGFEDLITESKKQVPHLFKAEDKPVITTGQAQEKFGGNKTSITNLSDALHARYKL